MFNSGELGWRSCTKGSAGCGEWEEGEHEVSPPIDDPQAIITPAFKSEEETSNTAHAPATMHAVRSADEARSAVDAQHERISS